MRTMSDRLRLLCLVCLIGCSTVTTVRASPITWSFNATYDDGGTASGYFIWDADTSTPIGWDIVSTAGTHVSSSYNPSLTGNLAVPVPAYTFTAPGDSGFYPNLSGPCSTELFSITSDNPRIADGICIDTVSPLTDAGGTVALASEDVVYHEYSSATYSQASIISGTLTSTPEPSTLPVLAMALVAILWCQ